MRVVGRGRLRRKAGKQGRLPSRREADHLLPAAASMNERRYDPTAGEWTIFATHRQDRTYRPDDSTCPLCPTPPGGRLTEIPAPSFEVAVFDNRFPSLTLDPPSVESPGGSLYRAE